MPRDFKINRGSKRDWQDRLIKSSLISFQNPEEQHPASPGHEQGLQSLAISEAHFNLKITKCFIFQNEHINAYLAGI